MVKHSVPSEKEFEVPKDLANKFAVQDDHASIPIESPKPEESKKPETLKPMRKTKSAKKISKK